MSVEGKKVGINGGEVSVPSEREWGLGPFKPYTFFPKPGELSILNDLSAAQLGMQICNQGKLTARFLHYAISRDKSLGYASQVVFFLGNELVSSLVKNDLNDAIDLMLDDFVPEDEMQAYLESLKALGLMGIDNLSRLGLRGQTRVPVPILLQQNPAYTDLLKYVERINTNQTINNGGCTSFRILDPSRGLRYVGIGSVEDKTGILRVNGIDGRQHYTRIRLGDSELEMAVIRR